MTIDSEDCVFETDDDSYVDEGVFLDKDHVPNQVAASTLQAPFRKKHLLMNPLQKSELKWE
jgi:hypothetical protein